MQVSWVVGARFSQTCCLGELLGLTTPSCQAEFVDDLGCGRTNACVLRMVSHTHTNTHAEQICDEYGFALRQLWSSRGCAWTICDIVVVALGTFEHVFHTHPWWCWGVAECICMEAVLHRKQYTGHHELESGMCATYTSLDTPWAMTSVGHIWYFIALNDPL